METCCLSRDRLAFRCRRRLPLTYSCSWSLVCTLIGLAVSISLPRSSALPRFPRLFLQTSGRPNLFTGNASIFKSKPVRRIIFCESRSESSPRRLGDACSAMRGLKPSGASQIPSIYSGGVDLLSCRALANAATQAGRSRLLALVFNPRQSSCSSWLGRRYSQIGSHGEQKLTNSIL